MNWLINLDEKVNNVMQMPDIQHKVYDPKREICEILDKRTEKKVKVYGFFGVDTIKEI